MGLHSVKENISCITIRASKNFVLSDVHRKSYWTRIWVILQIVETSKLVLDSYSENSCLPILIWPRSSIAALWLLSALRDQQGQTAALVRPRYGTITQLVQPAFYSQMKNSSSYTPESAVLMQWNSRYLFTGYQILIISMFAPKVFPYEISLQSGNSLMSFFFFQTSF